MAGNRIPKFWRNFMKFSKKEIISALFIIFQIITSTFSKAAGCSGAGGCLIYDMTEPEISGIAKKAERTVGIVSVQDTADKMPQQPGFIILAGHGASGLIGLGSGTSQDYIKGKDLKYDKLEDVRPSLEAINNRLNSNTVILLSGCYTGKGTNGQELTVRLARIVSKATIYANKNCVGLAKDPSTPSRGVCTYEGNKSWQLSSIVGANADGAIPISKADVQKVKDASCVK